MLQPKYNEFPTDKRGTAGDDFKPHIEKGWLLGQDSNLEPFG